MLAVSGWTWSVEVSTTLAASVTGVDSVGCAVDAVGTSVSPQPATTSTTPHSSRAGRRDSQETHGLVTIPRIAAPPARRSVSS